MTQHWSKTRFTPPDIPPRTVPAASFGARPGAAALQTSALQKGIDTLSQTGGGRLVLEAGTYRTGALRLRSGVELHLSSPDTLLQFVSEDPEQNYPVVLSHWEGSPCYNYSALLYALDAEDIAVTGPGTLDGGADAAHWWCWHHDMENPEAGLAADLQAEDRAALRAMNLQGVPVAQRIFGPGHFLRPNFFQPIRCRRVLLRGITLRNSPMWQINPVQCENVLLDGVTVIGHGPNNDGCDPESCRGVWVKGCRFDTGDDCISLKSGRDRDGREANLPCEDVLIERCEFADGHGGIALGSEMSGGIRRVLVRDCRFTSPNLTYALRLKSNARRGGVVEDICFSDNTVDRVSGAAVHGTMLYEDGRNGEFLPVFRNITVEKLTAHGGEYGIFLEAFREVPVTGLILRDIQIDGVQSPLHGAHWQDAVLERVWINGKAYPRPVKVRILGIPSPGERVQADARRPGGREEFTFFWQSSADGRHWADAGQGQTFCVPSGAAWLRLTAQDADGNRESSLPYRVLPAAAPWPRLACRGMLPFAAAPDSPVTRDLLTAMLRPLTDRQLFLPGQGPAVTRQELARAAMLACSVSYRNASTTAPVCTDAAKVSPLYASDAARALYLGFLTLRPDGSFAPEAPVSMEEAAATLERVADFAGL